MYAQTDLTFALSLTHTHIPNPNKSLDMWKRNRHSRTAAKQDALENRTPHPT